MTRQEKLIDQFERAVEEQAFLGTIPVYSHDREEQQAIDATRKHIKANYTRARNRLLKELK